MSQRSLFRDHDAPMFACIMLVVTAWPVLHPDFNINQSLSEISAGYVTMMFFTLILGLSCIAFILHRRSIGHFIHASYLIPSVPLILFAFLFLLEGGLQTGQMASDLSISYLVTILVAIATGVAVICYIIVMHFKLPEVDQVSMQSGV